MCFVWIWEQTAVISLYNINWLVCITERECVYCAVRTGSVYIILRSAHSVFMCFVWISGKTAIISLYGITWLVCIAETECLLRGTNWVFKTTSCNLVFKWSSSYGKVTKLTGRKCLLQFTFPFADNSGHGGTWADRTFGPVRGLLVTTMRRLALVHGSSSHHTTHFRDGCTALC